MIPRKLDYYKIVSVMIFFDITNLRKGKCGKSLPNLGSTIFDLYSVIHSLSLHPCA